MNPEPVVLINAFEVPDGQDEAFLAAWERGRASAMRPVRHFAAGISVLCRWRRQTVHSPQEVSRCRTKPNSAS